MDDAVDFEQQLQDQDNDASYDKKSHKSTKGSKKTPKRKKGTKLKPDAGQKQEVAKTNHKALAITYLHCWHENRDQWKFQKLRQTWLLRHLFDKTMLTKEDFKIALKYLENLQGTARRNLHTEAEKIVNNEEESDSSKRKRATKLILKLFSQAAE